MQPVETNYAAPDSVSDFVSSHKGKQVDAMVEQAANGALLRVRLMVEPTKHQVVMLQMAGIRAPRAPQNTASAAEDTNAEPCGAEARFFVEARVLQRNITVELLGFPPGNTAVYQNAPLVGVVKHPAGNIAVLLTTSGFARCVDQHAALLGADRMSELRKAEAQAKASRAGLWKFVVPANAPASGSPAAAKGYEAVVTRVFSGDTLFVRAGKDASGPEKRISLSSVRQPRCVCHVMWSFAQKTISSDATRAQCCCLDPTTPRRVDCNWKLKRP